MTPITSISNDASTPTTKSSWTSTVALSVAAFALVTTEFLPVGLLPTIADDFGLSEGTTGLMVTLPGLLAALAAPGTIALAGKQDRRHVLLALLALLVLSNIIVALSSSFALVLAGRALMGFAVGGFWTVGGSLGPRLQPENAAKASAVILSGVSLGTVAGVPAGSLMGELLGWRWVFGIAGAIALLVLILLAMVLPSLPSDSSRGLRDVPPLMRLPKIRLGVAAIFLLSLGQFGAYTFISPFLLRVTGIAPMALGAVLLAYGVAAFFGNFLGGWAAGRSVRGALIGTGLLVGMATLMLALLGQGAVWALALALVWGLGFGMLPIALQSWMFDAVPMQREAAQAVFVTLSQVAIGGGALAGGALVDQHGVTSVMWLAAITSLATATLIGFLVLEHATPIRTDDCEAICTSPN